MRRKRPTATLTGPVKEVTSSNFGLLIAYLLPGFVVLIGISFFSEMVRTWLTVTSSDSPTVGGFLYVTLASLAAGLTVSTVRWLVIDTIHHWTGLSQPQWDFSKLQQNIDGFDRLLDIHYRYYQHNAGMLVSLSFVYLADRLRHGFWISPIGWTDLGFTALGLCFIPDRGTRCVSISIESKCCLAKLQRPV